MYGPPGCGKTMLAKAVAHHTTGKCSRTWCAPVIHLTLKGFNVIFIISCVSPIFSLPAAAFIRVVGSEFVQKYLGEGPRMVRDVFRLAKENAPAIIFIDEIDAIATKRFDAQTGGTTFIHVVFSPCPARDCLRDELGRLTSLFPLQLTGKCRESYSSCSIRWTDSTRMSTSRWAEPLNCFPLWLHHLSACWLELHFIHCIVITASAAIQLREHPRGSRRHSSAP